MTVAGILAALLLLGWALPATGARLVIVADCVERALPSVAVPAAVQWWRCWEMQP